MHRRVVPGLPVMMVLGNVLKQQARTQRNVGTAPAPGAQAPEAPPASRAA